MTSGQSRTSKLWAEIKRRKVVRVVLAYLLVGWALIQVADATLEPLHLPPWAGTLVIWLVALGFPVAVLLAWVLDVKPGGIEVTSALDSESGTQYQPDVASIAVLPFVNMSGNADNEYFSDGLSEELLNLLARLKALRVCSRTTSFTLKGKELDMPTIARQLGVRHVLEGSVRRSGNRVRITAQLIDAQEDRHLWSEAYDRDLEDIFAVQDEIAGQIFNALQLTLSADERLAIQSTTDSAEALDYYLRGREYYHRSDPGHLQRARVQLEMAIEIDPDYALAWAWQTYIYVDFYWYHEQDPSLLRLADRASGKAVKLAPRLAESHGARAYALRAMEQFDEAEVEFEKAIAINPGLFEPIHHYAQMARSRGDGQLAAKLFERAAAVRPEDYQAISLAANMYEALGEFKQAARAAKEAQARVERAVELNPGDSRALVLGAGNLLCLGEEQEALKWIARAQAVDPDSNGVMYNSACFYAKLGKTDKALEFAEKALEKGSRNKRYWETDADFDSIRDHPRFKAILERM